MIKLLHTADWHIGKKLYDHELTEDHQLFFDWLLKEIKTRGIDYLVISGDVFDMSNPSHESLKLYYNFLFELQKGGCKAIITAGNHDSPALIDAPASLLNSLSLNVVGALEEDLSKVLIPLQNRDGKTEAIIAAVPFLRDRDIRKSIEGQSYEDRVLAYKEGIKNIYDQVADHSSKIYPDIPLVGCGHLYANGVALSDSERDVQIGNLAGISAETFHESYLYVALGHIHKTQNVGGQDRIRYCGSPMPLSFSERNYDHIVIELTIENGSVKQENCIIPKRRTLKIAEGSLEEIQLKIDSENISEGNLPSYYEIRVTGENFDAAVIRETNRVIEEINNKGEKKIIQSRFNFTNDPVKQTQKNHQRRSVSDISPMLIFKELIGNYETEKQEQLMQVFHEITGNLNQSL